MTKSPIWLDNNVLVKLFKGTLSAGEIVTLQKMGFEVLVPHKVEIEFLHGQGFRPEDTAKRRDFLKNLRST